MGTFSIWHWLVVLVVVLILFGGGGKLSRLMGDLAKGVTAFKKGLKEDGAVAGEAETPKTIDADTTAAKTSDSVKKDEAANT